MKKVVFVDWWLVQAVRKYAFALFTVALFALLFLISVVYLLKQARVFSDQLIVQDVVRLADVFKSIDEHCKIVSFDYQKNNIDFLNVEKFSGSEIGSMNLMLPDRWKGPYMNNPAVQGRVYQVVRTRKGYFIVPGDGVRLSSGKIIGKDIVLNEAADISALSTSGNVLTYQDKPLAYPLVTSGYHPTTLSALPLDGY